MDGAASVVIPVNRGGEGGYDLHHGKAEEGDREPVVQADVVIPVDSGGGDGPPQGKAKEENEEQERRLEPNEKTRERSTKRRTRRRGVRVVRFWSPEIVQMLSAHPMPTFPSMRRRHGGGGPAETGGIVKNISEPEGEVALPVAVTVEGGERTTDVRGGKV